MTTDPRIVRQCSARVMLTLVCETHRVVLFDNGVLAHEVDGRWQILRSPSSVNGTPVADISLAAHPSGTEPLILTVLFLDGVLAELQLEKREAEWRMINPLDWSQIHGPWLKRLGYDF